MDGNAIKNYCVWARQELTAEVRRRCALYDISEKPEALHGATVVGGRVLTTAESRQRDLLLDEVRERGLDALVERAAYTWFNRLMAIRYMEVNGLLPSRVRVLSSVEDDGRPDALRAALSLNINGLDAERAAILVEAGDDEALFREIFLAQCSELAAAMPDVFEPIGAALELLLPDGLLRPDGIAARMVRDIPEEDWTQGVEIVGWMYQFYVSERKKGSSVVSVGEIPA